LLEYLEGRTQTFITTSKESLIGEFAARAEVFDIRGGEAAGSGARPAPGATISTPSEGI
jgi:hypothetical protein